MTRFRIPAAIGLAAALLGACSGYGSDDPEVLEVEARMVCEGWVKNDLRAPSTADFSNQSVTSTGSDTWTVTGTVDAENGFGATVRGEWTCNIRLEDDGWHGSAVITGP